MVEAEGLEPPTFLCHGFTARLLHPVCIDFHERKAGDSNTMPLDTISLATSHQTYLISPSISPCFAAHLNTHLV